MSCYNTLDHCKLFNHLQTNQKLSINVTYMNHYQIVQHIFDNSVLSETENIRLDTTLIINHCQ